MLCFSYLSEFSYYYKKIPSDFYQNFWCQNNEVMVTKTFNNICQAVLMGLMNVTTDLLIYLLTYEKCKGKGFTYIIVTERWARS